ncbi:EI24 domain-containing protein [Benzoatithermus flavus]|uniref:EI24 domain-containing protein n=1 Tax=Benzoatithermus flavus TaxID=3108223 RepID=A0ABU8XWG8_9PROT
MLKELVRAFAELGDPNVRRVLWLGVGLSVLTLAALVVGVDWLLGWAARTSYGWINATVEVLGVLGTLVVSWFLFPSIVVAVSGLFLERVVDATEARYFPALPPTSPLPWHGALAASLRLLGLSLLLNLLALPLYFVPLLNLPLWLLLNGYLVGREYAELVGLRRIDPATLTVLRRQQRGMFWLTGIVIAFLLTIPVVNLIAPIVGASFMTQRFHRFCGEMLALARRSA